MRPVFLASALLALAALPAMAQMVPVSASGTWDVSAEACADPASMTRLEVQADRLRFVYGYAEVEEVERTGDVTFVAGQLHQEGQADPRPRPEYYRLDQQEGPGALTFKVAEQDPVALVRCPFGGFSTPGAVVREDRETLLYGTRAGETVTVEEKRNIGGSQARITFSHTRADAMDYCAQYVRDPSDACVEETRASVDLVDAINGDCVAGTWSDPRGRRFRLGEQTDGDTPDIVDRDTGEALGASFASGYPVALASFDALCSVPPEGVVEARSVYTDLDPAACEVIARAREGGGVSYRCEGVAGFDLFVTRGDGRHDVDIGARDEGFIGGLPFNTLGDTVEWRFAADDTLRAVIVRYRFEGAGDATIPSELAVIRPPRGDMPSCYIAFVPADGEPSHNDRARIIADQSDRGTCIEMCQG